LKGDRDEPAFEHPGAQGRPARLLDVVEGRSGSVLAAWLADRDSA
jgi:hypothetical protein